MTLRLESLGHHTQASLARGTPFRQRSGRLSTVRLVVRRRRCRHGCVTVASGVRVRQQTETDPGFMQELRTVAMDMHTKDQSHEGKRDARALPFAEWTYTLEGFMRFLSESVLVYDALESIIQNTVDSSGSKAYACIERTGLERLENLKKDIEWIESSFGVKAPTPPPDGAGATYARYLRSIAEDIPAFVCHYYNVYFAHAAGGRMIGKQVADQVLDKRFSELNFYQYERPVKQIVGDTKAVLNKWAESWTTNQKEACKDETVEAFRYTGHLLGTLFDD